MTDLKPCWSCEKIDQVEYFCNHSPFTNCDGKCFPARVVCHRCQVQADFETWQSRPLEAALAADRDRLAAEVERLREAIEWIRDATNVAPDWRRFPGVQAVHMHAKKALEEANDD